MSHPPNTKEILERLLLERLEKNRLKEGADEAVQLAAEVVALRMAMPGIDANLIGSLLNHGLGWKATTKDIKPSGPLDVFVAGIKASGRMT